MTATAIAIVRKSAAPAPADLDLVPLAPSFVAEVRGLDLALPQSQATIAALRAALVRHKLLLFRGQALTPRQQRDFAARFGSLHVHPLIDNVAGQPEIMVLEFDAERRMEESQWHTDVTFIETPPLGSILHGVVIPEVGGDTIFADLGGAHAGLSVPLQSFLAGLRARHDFAKSFDPGEIPTAEYRAKWERTRATHPPVSHPVVRTHPESGEKGLFVNEGFTIAIEGLARAESEALLAFLFAHSRKAEFTYRHRWQAGDVLFWDNRITQHYAVIDYWPRRRRMHRATILGDRPV
jgi:taurine dioxygenase